ncbi:MAG TPA: twin-arginine translocase subunit TatC [Steroidobacteraceae bacterium]|nr:twin-arginine translocase subunit TatC [Steroidobacteraceae bacterium]
MSNDEPEEKLAEGTLISHLLELRNRLIRAMIAWVIVFIPCAWKSNALFDMVASPIQAKLPPGSHLIATGVITPFMTPFKLAMYVALFIAMPYVLYQIWAFVAPGLYRHEKRFALPLVVSSILLFYAGIAFAFYAVFPVVFQFMVTTTPKGILMMTDISQYLDFVMRLFLAFGVAFEAPIAVVLLATTGLVSVEKLASNRGYVLIAIFVAAAALAPPDSISMIIMAVPMYLLYEAGLFFAKIAVKAKARREAETGEAAKA